MHLVSGTAGLGDDTLELIDLGLSTAERTETLLCQLTGALVLAVAEEFDNTTLVWGEARKNVRKLLRLSMERRRRIPRNLLDDLADESGALAQVTLGLGWLRADGATLGFLIRIYVSQVGPSPSCSERDPPRGETYVALVRSDGNAAAWGLSGHLDGGGSRDAGRCCRGWSRELHEKFEKANFDCVRSLAEMWVTWDLD